MEKPYRVLGLDIGIGSCGWAIIDTANREIVDMGVHLWEVPQEDKTKVSKAVARRNARLARRNHKRTADRKKHCIALFKAYGLMPEDADTSWLQTVKGDPQPLESRVNALDGLIENKHLAQALYNICARRGYIPHGEGRDGQDTEGRKVLSAIKENESLMITGGWRTVGEMMLKDGRAKGKLHGHSRNKAGAYDRCVTMAQLETEVAAIIDAQVSFGNAALSEDFKNDFIKCMTWEKDTKDHDARIYRTVGLCTYFGDEGLKAAAKACLSFEMCSAHERINHIRLVDRNGSEKALPADVKKQCFETLFSPVPLKGNKACKITYKKLRRELDIDSTVAFKGVDESDEKTAEVSAPKVWRLMRESLSTELVAKLRNDLDLADSVGSALAYSNSENSLRKQLDSSGLTDAEIDEICNLPYSSKLFSGYGPRSSKALRLLIDSFEDYESINSLSEAEQACGLKKKRFEEKEKGQYLPWYSSYDPTNKNPVVLRAMSRVRKIVNAILREYGPMDRINIELARDLKHSKKEKIGINKNNKANKDKRDAARTFVAEYLNIQEEQVSGKLIRKKILWDEQGNRDLYLDEKIDIDRLMREENYCQVDHILPESRTCDNRSTNKVLVLARSNQEKGGKSPYEWLEPMGLWDSFETRIRAMKLPRAKEDNFLEKALSEKQDKFIKRNLNDTRYATRAAMNYIADNLAFPDNGDKRHVYALAGGGTSALRRAWGFMKKDREEDDCHHAIDAVIIAACDQSTVIKIAKASEQKHRVKKEEREKLLRGTEPWPGFSDEAERLCAQITPTRRSEHGRSGQLFEETVYRFCGMNEKGTKAVLKGRKKPSGNYIVRKDGSIVLPAKIMELRLWWDGKTYLKEPVYYADLDAIRHDEYQPRYFKRDKPRPEWPLIPENLLLTVKPLVLHHGDAVYVGEKLLRYKKFDIDGGTLIFARPRKFKEDVKPKGGLRKAKDASFVRLVNEDILGNCYKPKA